MIARNYSVILLLAFGLLEFVSARSAFNQTSFHKVSVDLSTWSNDKGPFSGCVSCRYTCVKPKDIDGIPLNASNYTEAQYLPSAATQVQMNGCCYAKKGETKKMPSCTEDAIPRSAEPCGYLSGPTIVYNIDNFDPRYVPTPEQGPLMAIMFATIDCENFWALGFTYVKQEGKKVGGRKIINQGCYGKSSGGPIALVGCITSDLKFDKAMTYPWLLLAQKCLGLNGKCSRTNAVWGKNLKCCKDDGLAADWDKSYDVYVKNQSLPTRLSGLAVTGIVVAGVALLMLLVHLGAQAREKAKQRQLRRERDITDDYDEVITPLTADTHHTSMNNTRSVYIPVPSSITVSLHEHDKIYRPPQEEVLLEGDVY